MIPALNAAVSVARTASATATPPTHAATEADSFAVQLAIAGPRGVLRVVRPLMRDVS